MTRKEKIDWLYRLRSEICVYIPRSWLIPIYNALDTAIDELERETVSKESYDREYFLRKELELKVAKLEEQLARQKAELEQNKNELDLWERFKPDAFKWFQKYLILLSKVIHIRNGIENQVKFWNLPSKRTDESVLNARKAKAQSYKYCLEDLDKLIEGEQK